MTIRLPLPKISTLCSLQTPQEGPLTWPYAKMQTLWPSRALCTSSLISSKHVSCEDSGGNTRSKLKAWRVTAEDPSLAGACRCTAAERMSSVGGKSSEEAEPFSA